MSLFDATMGSQTTPLFVWLIVCTAMVAAMMLIGAITRLTESGLSMVEWRPLISALPPHFHTGVGADLRPLSRDYRSTAWKTQA